MQLVQPLPQLHNLPCKRFRVHLRRIGTVRLEALLQCGRVGKAKDFLRLYLYLRQCFTHRCEIDRQKKIGYVCHVFAFRRESLWSVLSCVCYPFTAPVMPET